MTVWQPVTKDSKEFWNHEPYEFFLVRPRGLHSTRGVPYCPTVVQLIDRKLYTPNNELDPLSWTKEGTSFEDGTAAPTCNPNDAMLDWCKVPE